MEPAALIESALQDIALRAAGCGASWIVGGSAGLLLRGIGLDAPPRDLDLYADVSDAARLHGQWSDWATDKPIRSLTPIYESVLSHYAVCGVAVELVGGFVVSAGGSRYEVMVNRILLPCADWVKIGASRVSVPLVPLAHELWFNWLRGREDRVARIVRAMAERPEHHYPALGRLEAANRLDPSAASQIRERLRKAGGD